MLIKVKGSQKEPKIEFQIYLGGQAQAAHDNGLDYQDILSREVLFYAGKKIKVEDLRKHIVKSTKTYLDQLKHVD